MAGSLFSREKKNHEYLQKPKKEISAGKSTGPIHKQLNNILGWIMAKH